MSLVVDCLRAFALLLGQMSEKLRPLLRKNQSKLKAHEKELLEATRSICKAVSAIKEVKLSVPENKTDESGDIAPFRHLFYNTIHEVLVMSHN